MQRTSPRLFALFVSLLTAGPAAANPAARVDFNRDIRPILSDTCFTCHGPDKETRKANLRLDVRESAIKKSAIVPGKPADSELVRRITSTDPDEVMPPPESTRKLKPQQIELLKKWIEQNAEYTAHWAFVAPKRPPLPEVSEAAWSRNPIDRLIVARLQQDGLKPSAEADRTTLIRRLKFDLIGLPPTPAEIDEFLNDQSPDAYEKLVDRFLASPHYGERMALEWLDAARFADTHGFHIDSGRDMTRWREWVIDAFNKNKPFDQFTIEQLAGDMLPNATLDQRIASGFNRNHMITFEGGAIPEEFQAAYVMDRVNTTGTVWLGLSVGCAQCHDHKYDPITQKDYYSLYAFFHNVPENPIDGRKGNAVPVIKVPTPEQEQALAKLAAEIQQAQERLLAALDALDAAHAEGDLRALNKKRAILDASIRTTMVMQERPKPRDTHILMRGQYDKKGPKVPAALPAFLSNGPLTTDNGPLTRLDLAKWLVDPANPLTARVTVNRFWQMYFGTGLVKTAEDFGSQGDWPSHPGLLDFLATEFMRTGWDVKAMQRLIVTSAAYKQSSRVTPDLLAKDPENRLLARGPRFRLAAEFIRDQALAISGLLNPAIGGRSVSPYQPPGLWEELMSRADGQNWTAQTYVQDHGPDLYRRTMYTFWKRTSPPPALSTFDAPDRETCTVRRLRTNTPLQALVLMNDPTYVEASRKLAERTLLHGGTTPDQRITFAFRLATARPPKPAELTVLRRILDQQLAAYRQNSDAAKKLLTIGESPRDEKLDAPEIAAWTIVSSTILNLDEVVTKN